MAFESLELHSSSSPLRHCPRSLHSSGRKARESAHFTDENVGSGEGTIGAYRLAGSQRQSQKGTLCPDSMLGGQSPHHTVMQRGRWRYAQGLLVQAAGALWGALLWPQSPQRCPPQQMESLGEMGLIQAVK